MVIALVCLLPVLVAAPQDTGSAGADPAAAEADEAEGASASADAAADPATDPASDDAAATESPSDAGADDASASEAAPSSQPAPAETPAEAATEEGAAKGGPPSMLRSVIELAAISGAMGLTAVAAAGALWIGVTVFGAGLVAGTGPLGMAGLGFLALGLFGGPAAIAGVGLAVAAGLKARWLRAVPAIAAGTALGTLGIALTVLPLVAPQTLFQQQRELVTGAVAIGAGGLALAGAAAGYAAGWGADLALGGDGE